jgi:heme/copper-type cytochrome/quinol oxidase subunit 2
VRNPLSRRLLTSALAFAAAGVVFAAYGAVIKARAQSKKDFAVTARKYSYKVEGASKPEIRVQKGDLVRITFSSEDIPHSFTIVDDQGHYRIMRRAEPGAPVTFEFLADKPGEFHFQCTLRADDRCRELSGTMAVADK